MAPPRVLVAGSLHYDVLVSADRLPVLDETLPGRSVNYLCGGKGGNQAVAAARHGAPTAFFGQVGRDAFGRTLLENLERAGVDRSGVRISEEVPSGMSVAIADSAGDYGAVIVSGANLTLDAGSYKIPASVRLVVLQNEIPESVNERLAAQARTAGKTVILNAAPARPFDTPLRNLVDILVLNRVEAAMLSDSKVDSVGDACAAARHLSMPGQEVIVTLGADGLVYLPAGGAPEHLPAMPVETVSSHGAGDAFVGALVARLAEDAGMAEALSYAQAAAALHAASTPESRHLVTPDQIEKALEGD